MCCQRVRCAAHSSSLAVKHLQLLSLMLVFKMITALGGGSRREQMVYIATSGSRSGFQCQSNVLSAFFRLYESTTVQRKDKYGGETVSGWRNVLEVSTVAFCHTGFGLVFSHHLYEGPCSKCYKSFIRCLSILIRPVYL